MIALANQPHRQASIPRWHRQFLAMLPAIRQHAQLSFRHLPAEARAELVQETVANCLVAYCRLVDRQQVALAFPSALARFAVAQVRSGRRIGCRLNSHDVSSAYAQRKKSFRIERLDHDHLPGGWRAAVVEDHHTPVDQQAAFRIDFTAWLTQLAPRHRRIVKFLAAGNSTSDAARRFRLSASRVSQLRRELHLDWLQFQKTEQTLPQLAVRRRMNPSQIDRAVSRATGESVREISHRGFRLADLIEVGDDPETDGSPQVLDWDSLHAQRPSLFLQRS